MTWFLEKKVHEKGQKTYLPSTFNSYAGCLSKIPEVFDVVIGLGESFSEIMRSLWSAIALRIAHARAHHTPRRASTDADLTWWAHSASLLSLLVSCSLVLPPLCKPWCKLLRSVNVPKNSDFCSAFSTLPILSSPLEILSLACRVHLLFWGSLSWWFVYDSVPS